MIASGKHRKKLVNAGKFPGLVVVMGHRCSHWDKNGNADDTDNADLRRSPHPKKIRENPFHQRRPRSY